jgi:butyrate kinase
MTRRLLVIYPKAFSTKIAVFDNRKQTFLVNIKHHQEEISNFLKVSDQYELRKNAIIEELKKSDIDISSFKIIIGRGGLLKPMEGGVYRVNDTMLNDTLNPMVEHESNLGGMLGYGIAKEVGQNIPSIIVDPACVDEMEEVYKISGFPEIPRRSILHTLNQRTIARNFAREIGKNYEEINVIVANISQGISVGAHKKGKIIDVNNGLVGEGPMSTERSGGVPVGRLVDMCFSGKYTKQQIKCKLKGEGGAFAYIGSKNYIEIEKKIEDGDTYAALVFSAIAVQVAKEIAGLTASLKGQIDGILITGELAHSNLLVTEITEMISHLGVVRNYPGEEEMEALAMHGYMVLDDEIEVKEYL